MPEHRMVTLILIGLFLLVVAIDFYRKKKLLPRRPAPTPGSPPAGTAEAPPPDA